MWQRFFWRFAVAAVLVLGSNAAFCALVDPYDIYGGTRIQGLTATPYKSEFTERMTKPVQMNGRPIETLILGNSKADFAIAPTVWRALTGDEHVYNAALRDGRLGEARALLEHAIDGHPELRRVLLVTDYESFRDNRRAAREFDDAQAGAAHLTPANVAKTLFSADALRDSLLTVRENRRRQAAHPVFSPNGKFHEEELALIFGQEGDFDKNLHGFLRYHQTGAAERVTVPYDELAAIRDLCADHGIELIAFVPPVYPLQAAAYAEDGEDYVTWMQRVAAIVPFYDFTLAPETGEDADYWDTAHMKDSLGRRVSAALAGADGRGMAHADTPLAGIRVTAETAASRARATLAEAERWLAAHPERQAELESCSGWSETVPEGLPESIETCGIPAWTAPSPQAAAAEAAEEAAEGLGGLRPARLVRFGTVPYCAREVRAVYAVLETPDGRRLYHRAQKEREDDIARQELLHDIRMDPCRYTLDAPMPGAGSLRVLVLLQDGRSCLSQEMEEIFADRKITKDSLAF